MPTRRRDEEEPKTRRKPATTPEAHEQQLVSEAMELAGQQMRDGTASSQVITHFLKAGSTREALEQQRLYYENELTQAKIKSIQSAERMEELYNRAISALRSYKGEELPPEEDVED